MTLEGAIRNLRARNESVPIPPRLPDEAEVAAAERALGRGAPADLLPLCEDNGDYHCLAPAGSVHYWWHEGQTHESWPDLATWIREVWIGQVEADEG